MMLAYLIGVAVGAIAALIAWIIWLDRKDELESQEEPDFSAWELEIISEDG